MKVFLLQDVPNLGQKGEVKEVSDGYGRNFLLVKDMACLTDDPRSKEVSKEKIAHKTEEKAQKNEIKEKASKLNGQTFTFKAKADKNGHLYGSIGPKELSEKIGIAENLFTDHYKTLGKFPLKLKISSDDVAEITIVVEIEK